MPSYRAVAFAVLLVAIAIGIIVGVVLARATYTAPPAAVKSSARLPSFEEKWRLAGLAVPLAKPVVLNETRLVKLEAVIKPDVIEPSATVAPLRIEYEPEPQVKPKRVRIAHRDVCRGKGKVYTKGGKSWRCKR